MKHNLQQNEEVNSVFFVNKVERKTNPMNNQFIKFSLMDKTGKVSGYLWDNLSKTLDDVKRGSFVVVDGVTLAKEGSLFIKIHHIRPAEDNEVDYADFGEVTPCGIDTLLVRLQSLVETIEDVHCRRLIESFIEDKVFMKLFTTAPAGIKIHHPYIGGLLEHTVSTMYKAAALSENVEERDIIVTSAFFHDIGKVQELKALPRPWYTDEGNLIGHIVLGYSIVEKRIGELGYFPRVLRLRLLHAILAHHGSRDRGSPVPPATPEAMMLPSIDGMDARVNHFALVAAEAGHRRWSDYDKIAKTRLYLVRYTSQRLRQERQAA